MTISTTEKKMKVFETIHTFGQIAVAIQDNTFVQVVTIDGNEKINFLKAELFDPNLVDENPMKDMRSSLLSAWINHLLALTQRIETLRDTNIMNENFVNALSEYMNENFAEYKNASDIFDN